MFCIRLKNVTFGLFGAAMLSFDKNDSLKDNDTLVNPFSTPEIKTNIQYNTKVDKIGKHGF